MAQKTSKKPQKNPKKRVLIALSGGIDSAVSAWKLLQEGYQVEAAFMKNWSSTRGLKVNECPWLVDRQDALRVAAFLGIPLHTLNFEKQYEKTVLDYFFKEYKAGRTPNPDVMCNKEIKFKLLYNWARKNNFDYLATGHYAQIVRRKQGPVDNFMKNEKIVGKWPPRKIALSGLPPNAEARSYALQRSNDEFKDQTYFIYNITTPQLPHLLFPIGSLKKSAVRAQARKIGLPNAAKRESMGLCFVGKIRLKDFLDQKIKAKPGPIVTPAGKTIGQHMGLATYTIGQRQGLRVGAGGPWFVVSKNLKTNTLVVTNNPHDKLLETNTVEIHSVNWLTPPAGLTSGKAARLQARFRHQGQLEPVEVTQLQRGAKTQAQYQVRFSRPQLAVASGQSLVLYDGKICVGGGVIV
jgi:tRNA-uridine 2-sulfurtransferase